MTSLFYTTQNTKYPLDTVAPYLETGHKLPYNLKVYRGYASPRTSAYDPVLVYDWETGNVISFHPNTVILAVGLTTSTAFTGQATVMRFGYSVGAAAPALTITMASDLPIANINTGYAFKHGTYGAQQDTANGYSTVGAGPGYAQCLYPVIGVDATASAGTVILTMLVMEMEP